MRRRSRFGRRGISSLIGAIFFVLVVFLVFSATVLIFENFTNYAITFKQVDSQDQVNKATSVGLSNFAFGGNMTTSTNETIQARPNAMSASLEPIQNMNFTNGMSGWTLSRAYELSLNNGELTNYPEKVLPGLEVYTLTVYNQDGVTQPSYITSVQISVSPDFVVPASVQQSPGANWNAPVVTGNTITWTAVACASGIGNGGDQAFDWAAVAPPVVGSYFHTVTLTWQPNTCTGVAQKGLAPVETNVVTSGPGDTVKALIEPVPSGTVPGGAFGGYDATSAIGSDSGPGSVYISYGPSLNGKPLTSGQQLTSQLNFTTDFSLGSPLLLASGCCTLSLGYALDSLVSNSSQVLLSAYLTDLSSPTHVKQIINDTQVNVLNGQNVSATGWQMKDYHFSLDPTNLEFVAGQLKPGLYALTVTVSVTLFGANAPSADYPASMLLHFDDIGLAFQEFGTSSYCADTAASLTQPCNSTCTSDIGGVSAALASCSLSLPAGIPHTGGVQPQQVQSMLLSAQVSSVYPGSRSTAYVYMEDIGASSASPSWVEMGQVSFNSSATITASIPASSASQYLDEGGSSCYPKPSSDPAGSVCVRVYVIENMQTPVNINVTLSVQTWQPDEAILYVSNNGTSLVHLVSLDIKGPDATYSNFNMSSWVSPGQAAPLLLGAQANTILPNFSWSTGQTYVVTVVTDEGITLTGTFVAP